ncbi:MAG: hypothetical protein ACFNS5_11890, partial [Prevotella melaninogenica]
YDNKYGDEEHILYHYKNNKLVEKETSTSFFNRGYNITKEKIQYDERGRIKRFYDYEGEKIVRTYTHYYDNKRSTRCSNW